MVAGRQLVNPLPRNLNPLPRLRDPFAYGSNRMAATPEKKPLPAAGRTVDTFAFGLFAVGLLVALCVFPYDPGDPPGTAVYPPNAHSHNLLGYPGATLADVLFVTLGVSVYLFLASWFVLVILLLLRYRWVNWAKRLAGLALLLPCATLLAEWWGQRWGLGQSSTLRSGGGSMGGWLAGWLRTHTTPFGQAALTTLWFILGLVLTADFLLLPLARWMLRGAWLLLGYSAALPGRLGSKLPQRRPLPTTFAPKPLQAIRPDTLAEQVIEDAAAPVSVPEPASIPINHHLVTSKPADNESAAARAELARRMLSDHDRFADYQLPALTLLGDSDPFPIDNHDQKLREIAALLEKTFADFHLNVKVVGINTGPVITQYEVALETGLRLNKVTTLADDIALNLKVPSVRIVAPLPGKSTVGIEVPNELRATVRLKEVVLSAGKRIAKLRIPLFLGKDTEGRPLIYDLAEMPHLLIAGRTGTGKSVCMNSLILSILMTRRPDEVKMIMIDPKQVELGDYSRIPHLMHPIVKDTKKAEAILAWAVDKMEERYEILSRARVRNIAGYNELPYAEILRRVQPVDDEEQQRIPEHMPYLVIIVDEVGDLMMQLKKEVEGHIIRLAQKSRAAGIHLVVATQKPTVDVITGLIKSNLPARICFQVSSRSDSRVVLDESGADKLLGKGDMLFLQPGTSTLIRAQGTYASDQEIQKIVEFLDCDPCFAQELIQLRTEGDGKGGLLQALRERDPLYEQAVETIIREGRGSVSLLQRALGIGYGRGARLIDYMAEDGIVGAYNGSSAREVLYTLEQWEQLKAGAA
jgi:DNA segregation ATPase FtsK/SpoIIIE, S-DNA-T family